MPVIPGLEGVSFAPIAGQIAYWFTIFLILIAVMGVFVAIFYFTGYPIKATVYPLYGSGKDGIFSVGVKKSNRIKWINQRTAWKSLFPLFNRIEREPFDSEFIYPGKGKTKDVIVFELNDQWIPGRVNINKTEKEIRTEINPVPYFIRNWQSLQHKKNAAEFAKTGFWEENKSFFITLGVVLFCCILCGSVIYFTYKYAAGGREDAQMIANAIRGFAGAGGQTIPG